MKFTPNFTRTEWKRGLIALCVSMLAVSGLIAQIPGLSNAQLNFVSYLTDAVVAVIFLRRFLGRNIAAALDRPFATLYLATLGYLGHLALGQLTAVVISLLQPEFINLNDQTIQTQLVSEVPLMVMTTVVLAPIVEECFFRGLLFRGLYDRSPAAAWTASLVLFAAVHVAGYIGSYSPLALLVSFIQYIPPGIVLCVTYQRSGNIISPIFAHAFINLAACLAVLR